jgi:hypothetical protein
VLGYTGAEIVEDACVRLPIARSLVDEGDVIPDEEIRAGLARAVDALASRVRGAAA